MERPEDEYIRDRGLEAFARQRRDFADRCEYCWARNGEAHTLGCPNLEAEEEAAPPTQGEALF